MTLAARPRIWRVEWLGLGRADAIWALAFLVPYVLTFLLFTIGDFSTVYFVWGGGPANSTQILATSGVRDAYTISRPRLGVAAVMSAIPVLVPLVTLLMRRVRAAPVDR